MRLGLVGDVHGMTGWLAKAYEGFYESGGVDAVLQVGDLSVDFPVNIGSDPFLKGDQANFLAEKYSAPLIYCPGNHDNFSSLLQHKVEPGGFRRIRSSIWMVHGGLMTLDDGTRLAALGGATSSDKQRRLDHYNLTGQQVWWPQESVDSDLADQLIEQAKGTKVDVLLTHEAPEICSPFIPERTPDWAGYEEAARKDRAIIQRLYDALDPKLMVTGHHHLRRSVRPSSRPERRIEMMGRDGQRFGMAAIYDTSDNGGSIENIVLEEW